MKKESERNLTIAICLLGLTLVLMAGLTFYSIKDSSEPQFSGAVPVPRAAPTWLEYSERIVGDSHPTYTSTINRPTKQVWNCYTSEHNIDCTHKPLPWAQWALTGTGGSALATMGGITKTWHDNYSSLTIVAVVKFDTLERAETIYVRKDDEYDEIILSFRKLASNKLALAYGHYALYSSYNPIFTDRNIGIPMEVGVSWDWAKTYVTFFADGIQESPRGGSSFETITSMTSTETHKVGAAWDGDIFFLSFGRWSNEQSTSAPHPPYREGLSQCPNCLVQYNMNEGAGATTLIDRVYEQYTSITHVNQNLTTINGAWTVFEQGY